MPEVSALMGIRQLQSLENFIEKRAKIALAYDSILKDINEIQIINAPNNSRSNYFKYTLILKSIEREIVHKALSDKGIQLSGYVYELPLHKQPVFSEYNDDVLPKTEYMCSRHVCLPIYPSLTLSNVKDIAKSLIDIL